MIQVLVVLALARGLGELFRYYKQPPLAGEIIAGILLGETVLGHISPELFLRLFPPDELQHAMFGVTAEIGILFLLLVVGLEVNVASAWKMRNQTFIVAVTGVVVPLAIGTGVAYLMYDQWVELPTSRFAFSLLVGAGVAITAITVVARLLFDLKIIKSDLGLFLISAMALNELLGWVVLAVVLGLVGAGGGDGVDATGLAVTMVGIVGFAAFCMTLGRWATTHSLLWMKRKELPSPAVPLSVVVCLGLLGGIVTGALGIHPVFGFLLAGMMAGDPRALSEHTRSIIGQMVESIFVPLFFAGICLHVDFASQFDVAMVLIVTVISVGGKFIGAWWGALMVPLPKANKIPIGLAHIPGGPMGVLLASVAKEAGVIGPKMFVALVVASIVSALLVGPLFTWALHRRRPTGVRGLFDRDCVVCGLEGATRDEVIAELAARAGAVPGTPTIELITKAVLAREKQMGTGVGEGIAIPHARIADLAEAMVVVGTSMEGIEWDAIDDKPAHLVFLVLTPSNDNDRQLEILSTLATSFSDPDASRELFESATVDEAWASLQRHVVKTMQSGEMPAARELT
jgi:Kef-type K+ transport system membrane component KefB/mannitol/fructose-specific phosphotransferase system IIA component